MGDAATTPLARASGEVHAVPTPANGVSTCVLRHLPAPNTPIAVRGVSVTVRAMWAQPRGGDAYIINPGMTLLETLNMLNRVPAPPNQPNIRNLRERWQARTATVVLPAGAE